MAGDVLDLVGDRTAVRLTQRRERLRQRGAGNADAHQVGRHARHRLRRQPEWLGVQSRVTDRLAAERIEPRRQVSERPIGPYQGHAGGHRSQIIG